MGPQRRRGKAGGVPTPGAFQTRCPRGWVTIAAAGAEKWCQNKNKNAPCKTSAWLRADLCCTHLQLPVTPSLGSECHSHGATRALSPAALSQGLPLRQGSCKDLTMTKPHLTSGCWTDLTSSWMWRSGSTRCYKQLFADVLQ